MTSPARCTSDPDPTPVLVVSRQTPLRWYWHVAVLCAAAALLISRQPDALFHAQFYGEDGHVWFADAFNRGWFTALFRTQDGYFQTLPRLAAALALIFPLALAPLVMNIVGLAIQLLPVPLLLSTRLSGCGSLPFRALLALVYLALPNSREVNVTVTEAQWHLALVACLLVLASPRPGKVGHLFDAAVLLLCGLTGPFCILLLPIGLSFALLRRSRWDWMVASILVFTAALQAQALLYAGAARQYRLPLGASAEEFVRIVAGQVYLGALIGSNSLASMAGTATLALIAIAGTAILAYAAYGAGKEFRLFLFFSILLLAASLARPVPGPPGTATTAWQALAGKPAIHYWFFPTLSFAWAVITLLVGPRRTQLSQAISILLMPVMLIGFMRDWRYSSFPDLHFARYAEKVLASKQGETVVIPETPPGWTLRLVAK